MRLHEWEGKEVLARHGVPVPRGRLWSQGPPDDSPSGWVVKAQTLAGGRGLRGGVLVSADLPGVREAAQTLVGTRIGDETVGEVYVEERVSIERELYAGLVIDREAGAPRLLLSEAGGVDVERHPERVAGLTVPPEVGLRPFHVRELMRRASLEGVDPAVVTPFLEALWTAFLEEEAELIEINPLAITVAGDLVALDARIVLDDGAAARHPGWPAGGMLGSTFERRCADLGAVGIELDGDVAAIVSGAGLMMATVDLLVSGGGSVRAAVDLGGLVLKEADELAELVEVVGALRPRAVLVNAFFQLATCDALARGLAVGLRRAPLGCPFIVRLRGRGLEEARAILEPLGAVFETDLGQACRSVVTATRSTGVA